ncbi:MAG: hypothetical protein J6D21_13095 [Clostridia bacterium]|nr:hypothetical protein [Clostridia bacterium]
MSIYFDGPTIYGKIHYFKSTRCFNTEEIKRYNQYKITCSEIVSFDCLNFEMSEIDDPQVAIQPTEQIIACITRPSETPCTSLETKGFTFCGYDLVEEFSGISSITACDGSFASIPYDDLTEYGLIPTYELVTRTQQALLAEDPNDSHADCEICEIWRRII